MASCHCPPTQPTGRAPPCHAESTPSSYSRQRSPSEPEKTKCAFRIFSYQQRFRPPFDLKLGSLDSSH
ncbi:hypothetical protein PanWU01x14_154340, partial [Parasponia andersonii]